MPSVLFICTANICRSPMAEGLFRARLGEEASAWRVESAGTWAPEGEPAASRTLQVLSERGIELGEHRSRMVTRDMLGSFQLILTMEQGHKEALQVEFPEVASRIYLLSEMIGRVHDIRDPMGGPLVDYRDAAREIDQILERGFQRIGELAGA